MAGQDAREELPSRGVDELIGRLRDQGVAAGRGEAERIVAKAESEARRILEKAETKAREKLETAQRESDAYRSAGEAALKTAMRDAVLGMKSDLMDKFSADVGRLVSLHLKDPDMLKQMILEVAGRLRDDVDLENDDDLEIILPATVAGLEDLRQNPQQVSKGKLAQFVLGLTGEMLRDGVRFSGDPDMQSGIRVKVEEKDIELELTEQAVASLLLRHLQPRFRALLEGIVK